MGNINYENAKFSLAMIDFRNYTSILLNLDKTLEEADFVFDRVMRRVEKTEVEIEALRRISFTEYAKVQQYLKTVTKSILKYQTELKDFLQANDDKQQEFDNQLDQLIPLVQQYEKTLSKKIEQCFEIFQAHRDINRV